MDSYKEDCFKGGIMLEERNTSMSENIYMASNKKKNSNGG